MAEELILLVEDDPEARSMLSNGLEEAGYRCLSAGSAEEVLELLEDPSAGSIAAAVTDVVLPGMDGVQLGARLKEWAGKEAFMPIILIGGTDLVEERVRGFRAGCDDFLGKPLSLFELEVRLASLLARRREHEELARANARLRAAHEKKRELAALVVHDLRNPLSALLGHVELLADHTSESADPRLKAGLAALRELAGKALTMVAGILDVEELEEGLLVAHPEEVELEPFVREVSRHHRITADLRSLSMEFRVSGAERARFDPHLVSRVLENLFDNAVRYAPRGGRVVLRTSIHGGELVIQVGNDGPPVPESERPRIFGRFYRLEARRAGARANRGLGLYFCRLAAEAHGGSIDIDELPDLPACFTLRLPQ